ncbi:hypothetical protein HR060_07085 [Catenovulum sp. SM1970]|uniref:hypothetical protein n=1 Tax=Marinifaba aquimaris TaxID=2741323 RepID=UPI001573483C|nr:hypothetical protein [Marinifaba aquimaris]NTS76631.1 hypothetical protein [Marinifaba aquimaris]
MQYVKTLSMIALIGALQACGGGGGGGGSTANTKDTTPTNFTFAEQTDTDINSEVLSETITISGLSEPVPIRVNNAVYSIDGGAFTSDAGTISNGQTLVVRVDTGDEFATQTQASITVGSTTRTFTVQTRIGPDKEPDAFYFNLIDDVETLSIVKSETVTITGIEVPTEIGIANGTYSIDGGAFTDAPSKIENGQTLTVRTQASANFSTETVATITIGEVTGLFNVMTIAAPDLMPDALVFDAFSDTKINTHVTSNSVVVTGINRSVDISIEGGWYSVDGGQATQEPGMIDAGASIVVSLNSASEWEATAQANLTIGELTTTLSVNNVTERVGTDNTGPEVVITQPSFDGLLEDSMGVIAVTGLAYDQNPISSIKVAGKSARFLETSVDDKGDTVVNWLAIVHVPENESLTLAVESEDSVGNNSNLSSAPVISNKESADPVFIADIANERYLTLNNFRDELSAVDFNTGEKTQILQRGTSLPYPAAANVIGDVFYISNIVNNNQLQLTAVNAQDGTINTISSNTIAVPDDLTYIYVWNSVYLAAENALYYTFAFHSPGKTKYSIMKMDLDDNQLTTLVDDSENQTIPISKETLGIYQDKLIGKYEVDLGQKWLVSIDPVTGETALLSEQINVRVRQVVSSSGGELYLIGLDGIYQYDLAQAQLSSISAEIGRMDVTLQQVRGATLNKDETALLIKEDDYYVEVDLATGKRTASYQNNVGTGTHLAAPRDLVLDVDTNKVYIADDGLNAFNAIIEVDLATGVRSQLVDTSTLSYLEPTKDIALDKTANQLVVPFETEIAFIDLSTKQVERLNLTSLNQGIRDAGRISLDTDNKLAYLAAKVDSVWSILTINYQTKALVNVFKLDQLAEYTDTFSVTGLAYTGEAGKVYGVVQSTKTIYQFDLNEGTIETFANSCINNANYDLLANSDSAIQNIVYRADTKQLAVTTDSGLVYYDIEEPTNCHVLDSSARVEGWTSEIHYLDFAFGKNGEIFATELGSLSQLQATNGRPVVIGR